METGIMIMVTFSAIFMLNHELACCTQVKSDGPERARYIDGTERAR